MRSGFRLSSTSPRRQVRATRAPVAAVLLAAAVLTAAGAPAHAQDYPKTAIHLIVPYPPGGSPDIFARTIGAKLAEAWKQPVIVDNRAGGGGTIGTGQAAKAAPDGYTLLMGHIGTLAVNATLFPKLPYDPVRSFAPVTRVAIVPNVLVVNPAQPFHTVGELISYARANPGKLLYSSGGNGGAAHIAMEYFKQQAGVDLVHVPYKGTSPSVTDLIGGQVAMTMTGAPPLMPHIQAGRLRALGVSSAQRIDALPQVPTIAESGVKGFDATQWYGIVAPAGTPRPIIDKLNREIRAIVNSPEMRERLRSEGAIASTTTPEEFGAFIRDEIARWGAVVTSAGIRPD
jgi:tripartite-type tricarboxylate transporter receptor subunit TctC